MFYKLALQELGFHRPSALGGIGPDSRQGDTNLRRSKSRLHTEQELRGSACTTVASTLSRGFSKLRVEAIINYVFFSLLEEELKGKYSDSGEERG